ncbi:MAG: protein-L-isoaspartate(D-aspartate) O-methyltransferase [Bacteroidetes bacterium]|nr:protein-L-isoaspartate(D-aspartate) O-methyltransferase [Bacteroidota bacterium]
MYESERDKLIDELTSQGITDVFVIKAIHDIPREKFVPEALQHQAYKNIALPIGKGQTISQPYTVAIMTQALKLEKGLKVLEVGTGSGYQAAILLNMGAQVFTIERDFDLYQEAKKKFDKMEMNIACMCGDGTVGWNEFAPYDRIIVTAAAPDVPKSLLKQLKIGGIIVVPVGSRTTQIMHVVVREDEEKYSTTKIPAFQFVPLIGMNGWKDD